MSWTLILLVYVGPMSDREAVSLTSVPGFTSHGTCAAAGKAASSALSPGTKSVAFACVEVR